MIKPHHGCPVVCLGLGGCPFHGDGDDGDSMETLDDVPDMPELSDEEAEAWAAHFEDEHGEAFPQHSEATE